MSMRFDGMTDISGSVSSSLPLREGSVFPETPLTGELFKHTTHGLCVFCHDSNWRQVLY